MTHPSHNPANAGEPRWDVLIQRCADGELDDEAERSLLARLEFQPDGWRRLALSFIEQRVLGEVCRSALPPAAPAPVAIAVVPHRQPRRITPGRLAALCAGLLAAFGAGRMWPSRGILPDAASVAPSPLADADGGRVTAPTTLREPDVPRRTAPRAVEPQPAMFVNWSLPGSEQGIDVPVYAAPSGLATWQPFSEPALSREELESLRRAGYQVSSQRDLLRLQSPEGHTVVLPVEALDVRMSRY